MKRREFLAASCAAGLLPLSNLAHAAPDSPDGKELLELRACHFSSDAQRERCEEFLAKAFLPALNRLGVAPVGVFVTPLEPKTKEEKVKGLILLMPHKSAESVVTLTARLAADDRFTTDGESWLELPKNDPLYARIDSSLLLGFDQCPKVDPPPKAEGRLFQLRCYESHSDSKALKKIEMFNAGGEIALFRKVGMNPVFFGQTLIGADQPNLTYMLSFPDEAAQKAAWAKFLASPEWKTLSSDPAYADTVSHITNRILSPAACSQI